MSHSTRRFLLVTLLFISFSGMFKASAMSFDLDSVAEWGKFPRFCVNTYRWADRFFNTYDTAYVEGSGYKFNVKLKTNSWTDNYVFTLPDNYDMHMRSDFCTSSGLWVSYLAVSLGYDVNVSKWFGGSDLVRKKMNFRFNSAMITADLYWVTNNVGTTITKFGQRGDLKTYNERFTGIDNQMFGVDLFHFINSDKYSNSAAFNYGRIQKRSQGSWFVGFSYYYQDYNFDFSHLTQEIVNNLPDNWADNGYHYGVKNHNYSVRGGYAYNWVFNQHWMLGVLESPIIGIKHGRLNDGKKQYSPSLYNRFMLSCVWNNKRWFGGVIGTIENGFLREKDHSLLNGVYNIEATLGWRFNLW